MRNLRTAALLLAFTGLLYSPLLHPAHSEEQKKHLEVKLRLAALLISKIDNSFRYEFENEIDVFKEKLEKGSGESLEADIDEMISRISQKYRNRKKDKSEESLLDKIRYTARVKEVESYKGSLEQMLASGESVEDITFNEFTYYQRVNQAKKLADEQKFAAANLVLESAYNQLIAAITELRDARTIEYKLAFESVQDEYEYEVRRYESQKMLIELSIEERVLDDYVVRKLEEGLALASETHKAATRLASIDEFEQSLFAEEEANRTLSGLLRLLGYFF